MTNGEKAVHIVEEDLVDSTTDSERDTDVEERVWSQSEVNLEAYKRSIDIYKNEIIGKRQRFSSADAFRYNIWKYAVTNQFDYKLERNCKQRIVVKCKVRGCNFYIYVRGHLKFDGMTVKEFRGQQEYSVGDRCQMGRWGKRRLRAKLLARMIECQIRLSTDYSPTQIMKD